MTAVATTVAATAAARPAVATAAARAAARAAAIVAAASVAAASATAARAVAQAAAVVVAVRGRHERCHDLLQRQQVAEARAIRERRQPPTQTHHRIGYEEHPYPMRCMAHRLNGCQARAAAARPPSGAHSLRACDASASSCVRACACADTRWFELAPASSNLDESTSTKLQLLPHER